MKNDVITLGNQSSSLNGDQIKKSREYIMSEFGLFCGAGADDNKGCKKTPKELEIMWSNKFLEKGEKIPVRKKPYLIINEKNGYGLDRLVNGDKQYFGNVCYYCYSCNQLYDKNNKTKAESNNYEPNNYESKKSKEVRPMFPEDLKNHLAKHGDICHKACVNKWSRAGKYDCSQQLLNNILHQMMDEDIELVDKNSFGLECNYSLCSGQHIILLGRPPTPNKSDYTAMMEENTPKDE